MALIRTGSKGVAGFLNPRDYICISSGSQTKGTYTSGTAISDSSSDYGKGIIINVKGISGTLALTASQNTYFNIVGVLDDGTISFHDNVSTATTSFSKSFSDVDYLYVATGISGTPTITYTITDN